MSEAIVIKDKKKRKLKWILLLSVLLLDIVVMMIASFINKGYALVLFVLGIIPSSLYVLYITRLNDKIKFKDDYLYCKSKDVKSKYVSFLGNAKIPLSEIKSVKFRLVMYPKQFFRRLCFYFTNEIIGSIDICDDALAASIPCLGVFSSKKYIEDVESYFTQKGINVSIEEIDKAHATIQTEQNTRKCTTDNLSSVSEANEENIVNNSSEDHQINHDEVSQNISTSRRRNIMNANNTNSEIKPSIKQNEHKGRRLEL